MIPPNCGIAISRPELLPAMMKCLSHCPPEVRDMWFGGMASVIQSPSAAAAMYLVCDKLIQVGRNDGMKSTMYRLICYSIQLNSFHGVLLHSIHEQLSYSVYLFPISLTPIHHHPHP